MGVITRSKSKIKSRINIFYKGTWSLLKNIKLPQHWRWISGNFCPDDCDYPRDESYEGPRINKNELIIELVNILSKNNDEYYAIDIQNI